MLNDEGEPMSELDKEALNLGWDELTRRRDGSMIAEFYGLGCFSWSPEECGDWRREFEAAGFTVLSISTKGRFGNHYGAVHFTIRP